MIGRPDDARALLARFGPTLPLSIALAIGAALSGCGARPPEPRWIDDATFVVPKRGLVEALRRRAGRDLAAPLRMAVALDHNCPLEDVDVLAEERFAGAPARYRVVVCGEERIYLEHPGAGFVDISASASPEPQAPAISQPSEVPEAVTPPIEPPKQKNKKKKEKQ